MAPSSNSRTPSPIQWKPPADPDKPAFPYRPQTGRPLDIRGHDAPKPFGHKLYAPLAGTREQVRDTKLKTTTQTALVVEHPPSEPTAITPAASRTARLTITGTIAAADGRGAQVVACLIEEPAAKTPGAKPRTYTAVAKIYDALYYPFMHKEYAGIPLDPTYQADMDYTREAAALKHLTDAKGQLEGFTPLYFGSWTFSLDVRYKGKIVKRPVRLILMEKLTGASMLSLYRPERPGPDAESNAHYIKEDWRLAVLARLLEGEVRQHHGGVDQWDMAARNVYLVPPKGQAALNPGAGTPRVVLIDYNNSIVWKETTIGALPDQQPNAKLPPSPMWKYWDQSLPEFCGWYPKEWQNKPKLRQQWLVKTFGGKNASAFAPIQEKLSFTE